MVPQPPEQEELCLGSKDAMVGATVVQGCCADAAAADSAELHGVEGCPSIVQCEPLRLPKETSLAATA